MRTWTQFLLMSFAVILTLSFAPARVQSQCPFNITVGTPNIGSTPGAPFSAERISLWAGAPQFAGSPLQPLTELVARDSEGRVRIERVVGKFKLLTGNETTEVEKRIVTICDPVAHQIVLLDEMNKTAQVVRQGTRLAPNLPRSSAPFCNVPDAMEKSEYFRVENLGHKTLEGVDTEGVRITTLLPNRTESSRRDLWCSNELSAVLLETMPTLKSEIQHEVRVTKLDRQEPDSTLFRIPSDYTVSEKIPERQPRAPGTPTLGILAPSKVQPRQ